MLPERKELSLNASGVTIWYFHATVPTNFGAINFGWKYISNTIGGLLEDKGAVFRQDSRVSRKLYYAILESTQ